MKLSLKIILSSILICITLNTNAQNYTAQSARNKRIAFKVEMSKLWIDNAIWSRQAILCINDKLPGAEESLYRLMVNQEDMGRLFTRYYGAEAGENFCDIIGSNTALTISIIRNKSNRNTKDLENAQLRMSINVGRVSNYLAAKNPFYTKEELVYLFSTQLQLFDNQLQSRINGNYVQDVENFDKIITETYRLADILSEGIIKQFPERFE